jgi:endoglucanase
MGVAAPSLPHRARTAAALLCALAAVLLTASAAPLSAHAAAPAVVTAKIDPRRTQGLFVDPLMPAATKGKSYGRLGGRAQALWVTDYYSIANVRSAVYAYTSRASAQHKTPILAIYAIPDRDCGRYSAGGLHTAAAYKKWLNQIALGLTGSHAIVVLEPDAVPDEGGCAGQGDRAGLLAWASARLAKTDAWVYLDAGNTQWHAPDDIANLLKASGVAHVRGISLNVGNFRPTAETQAYASQVLQALQSKGIRGKHYIIDTSRNGAKPQDDQVCNPPWARIGTAPQLLFRGAYDGGLWIKHPGESDGSCNGGPSSGAWSDQLANRLLGRSS